MHNLKFRILREEGERYGWGFILIHKDRLKEFLNELLTQKSKLKLLDVGAWKCMLKGWLDSEFPNRIEYVGIDVIDLEDRRKDVEFYVMSGDSLLFPSNTFDVVVYIETLEHIPNYVEALKEAYRILKPNGGLFIQSVICYDKNALLDRTHLHVLHPVTLKRLLEWIGFTNIEYIEDNNFVVTARKSVKP